MGSRTTIVVMFLFILPMLIVTDISPVQRVSAASNCDNGDWVTPKWNTTVERLAKVPNIYTPEFEYEEKRGREIAMMVKTSSLQNSRIMMVLRRNG